MRVVSKEAEVDFMKLNSKPHTSETETQPGTKRNYLLEMKPGQMNKRAKLQRSSIKRGNPIHEATEVDPNDFGLLFTATTKMTDQQMYHIIQNKWKPTKNFDFPQTVEGQRTRRFSYGWLEKYPWLAYSKYFNSCFCVACSLFSNRIGKNSRKLTKLLSEPLTLWTSAVTKFREHEEKSNVHRFSIQAMLEFIDIMENRVLPVDKVGITGLQ